MILVPIREAEREGNPSTPVHDTERGKGCNYVWKSDEE